MIMRVTQSMLAANMLRNLSNSFEQLSKYQEQLATRRKISHPSDDPVVAMKGMAYRTNLTEVEQYTRNLSEMYKWMENSEAGLEQANAILQRARELVVQASNDTLTTDDRMKIKAEITQLKEALVNVANTNVAGVYIFNGTKITEPPVVIDPVDGLTVKQNSDPYNIELSKGVQLRANIDPKNVFSQDLFDMFTELEVALDGGQTGEDINPFLNEFDKHIGNLLAERAELGARYNRVELIENRLSKQEVIAYEILKDNEGADMERVITDLKMQETIHRATLAVGARVIQPSLVDFLR